MKELKLAELNRDETLSVLRGVLRYTNRVEQAMANGDPMTRRRPEHELDYGDDLTVMLQLKLVGLGIDSPDMRFGTYLGKSGDDKFVVARFIPPVGFEIDVLEVFDTEDEMKIRWRLD